jgi:hypothetical protein
MDFRDMKLTRSLAACAVVGTLVLAGCGGKDSAADDAAKTTDAATTASSGATASGATGSADATGSAASSGSTANESDAPPAKGEGVTVASFVRDLKDGSREVTSSHARITMEVAGQTIVSEGDIDTSGKQPEAIMTMTMSQSGKAEIRLVDGTFYMRMAAVTKDKFMVIKLDQLPASMSQSLDSLDPGEQVDQYARAITAVTYLGKAERAGVDVEHYRVRMNSAQVAGMAGGVSLPKTVVMELYLDDAHRMRGMQMEVPVQGKKFLMDGTFSQFGKEVDVQKPAASQLMSANG